MVAAALRLKTPISAIRETARRSPWANGFKAHRQSPVAELWARIEQEYARAPLPGLPGAPSND